MGNQRAYDWALANAETSVRARFEKDGEPFVMVDDKPASIGITGPEWIKDELVYTRTDTSDGSQIEIQIVAVCGWQHQWGGCSVVLPRWDALLQAALSCTCHGMDLHRRTQNATRAVVGKLQKASGIQPCRLLIV